MGGMKGKQAKIDAAFGRLADMTQSEYLLAVADIVEFLDIMVAELKDRRAECETLRNIIDTLDGGAVSKEYTLREVIGDVVLSDIVLSDVVLSDWSRWVAVDANGGVWEYAKKPTITNDMWNCLESRRLGYIGKVAPPLNFENCIWEIKNGN